MGQDVMGSTGQGSSPIGGAASPGEAAPVQATMDPTTPSGTATSATPPTQEQLANYNYGFGASPTAAATGQTAPAQTAPGVIPGAPARAPQDMVNQFLSPNFVAPYYNAAATAGNLGTMMTAGVAPQAAQFMQSQFDPNLNSMEQSFMGAGLNNASRALEQGMMRQESQFEETPFHSGLARAQGDVMNQTADSLIGQGAQLGLQREQMANQTAQFPFNYGLQAAQVGPNMSERYFNLLNNAYQQPTELGLKTYSQLSAPSPVINTGSGSSSKP